MKLKSRHRVCGFVPSKPQNHGCYFCHKHSACQLILGLFLDVAISEPRYQKKKQKKNMFLDVLRRRGDVSVLQSHWVCYVCQLGTNVSHVSGRLPPTFGFLLAKEALGHFCKEFLSGTGGVELWHRPTAAGRKFIRSETLNEDEAGKGTKISGGNDAIRYKKNGAGGGERKHALPTLVKNSWVRI